MKALETDLNHRERATYAKGLRLLEEHAAKAAAALEAADDTEALLHIITLSLVAPSTLNELGRIFMDATTAAKAVEDIEDGERP